MLHFKSGSKQIMRTWRLIPFPDQIKRLLIIFIILFIGLSIFRKQMTPPTFDKEKYYRTAAVDSISALPIYYAGENICSECHDEQAEIKRMSRHKNVACEACHGPGANHIDEPSENNISVSRNRALCSLCHTYNASKPTGFPQIDQSTHNPLKPCMSCHEPHNPKPPHIPEECGACHGEIARTKAVSHHTSLECTQCHITPEKHKENPLSFLPGKPQDRKFCGKCHGEEAESDKIIPRVDILSHETGYECWQCHYPHYPEVR